MKIRTRILAAGGLALAAALPASAHEGHGQTHGLLHYLYEPEHALPLALLLLLGALLLGAALARRARS